MEQNDLEERLDPTINHRAVIVLLSGGIDSTVLAALAHTEGRLDSCVFVDYGQPAAQQEGIAASLWCKNHGVPIRHFLCPLDAAEIAIGTGEPGPRVMAGRNLVLLSLAVHHAARSEIGNVWIGANWNDRKEYPDCGVAFLHELSAVAFGAYGVRIAAPYAGTDRKRILSEAEDMGVDLAATWSCYEPTVSGEQCGVCNSCKSAGRKAVP